jgi:hypothetical protein
MNYLMLGTSLASFALPCMLLVKREQWLSDDVIIVHVDDIQTHADKKTQTP